MKTLEQLQAEKLEAEIERIKTETEQIRKAMPAPSSGNDLLNQKLNAEIAKLKEETEVLRKPWYRQPAFLGLIISFSVPIVSLVAAYYLGGGKQYFDAQTTLLQVEKKELKLDIEDFEVKKQSLKQDSIRLAQSNKDNQREIDSLAKKGRLLDNELKNRDRQMDHFRQTSGFYFTLNSYFGNDYLYTWSEYSDEFKELMNYLRDKEFGKEYTVAINKIIDSTRNRLRVRAGLEYVMYRHTKDKRYRAKLLKTISDNSKQKSVYADVNVSGFISEICADSVAARRDMLRFMCEEIRMSMRNKRQAGALLSGVSYLISQEEATADNSVHAEDLCFLIGITYQYYFSLSANESPRYTPYFSVLEHISPVAFACILSAELATPIGRQGEFDQYAIERISGVINDKKYAFKTEIHDFTQAGWRRWRDENQEMLGLVKGISAGNCPTADTLARLTAASQSAYYTH